MARRKVFLLLFCFALFTSYAAGVPDFLGPSSRTTYIDENSPGGTRVMTVYASDPDGAAFTFSLTPSGQFTIDPNSGVVTVAASPSPPLDREVSASISITINLNSGGAVVDDLRVTIFLNDVNDNSPVWRNPITSLAQPLAEDSPLGTLVYSIVASDADIGENGNIRFRIESPPNGTFAVHALSGVVKLARPLDFNTASTLRIVVIAEDQGSPSRSTRITFTVPVSAVVAPPPVFTQTHYSVSINEGDYSSTNLNNIVTVVAVARGDPTATIMYSQVMRNVPSDALFSVSSSGAVNIVGVLDREAESTYDVQVQAYITVPGMPNTGSDTALVTVTVLDVNDNNPVFENPHPEPIILMETTPISTVVYTFYATDEDQGTNGRITYNITSPVNGPFSIGATSGVIHLTNTLDHSTNPTYTITVQAQDGGSPSRSAMNSLMVRVTDVVDAAPTFTETVYSFEVAEGSYSSHQVGVVRATDTLNPSSAIIRYERIPRDDELFSVTPSGRITLTGNLDREMRDTYTLNIRAFRVATVSSTVPLSGVSIVPVVIIVTDVNDNDPEFTSNFIPLTVPESLPVGTDIFTVTASDDDIGSNGQITYSFLSPADNLPFSIGPTSGIIRLTRILDYDVQTSYSFTVQAQDRGTTPRSTSRMLRVQVQDVQDPPPTFTETVYSVEVAEGTYMEESIITVRAQDSLHPDATIRYEKASGDSIFTVTSSGASAGEVILTGTVDAERVQTYTITIQAFRVVTGTSPRSDRSTVSVVITITDINDNSPVWTDPTPGPVNLVETRPIGTNVLTVAATDADSGTNGEITYSLPVPVDGPFTIGASSGTIRLAGPLDFTVRPLYRLNIVAQDGGDPARSISVVLIINITDVLDPPPTFSQSVYTEEILEGTYTNELVSTVRAIDPISPSTAILRYEKVDTGDTLFTVVASGNNAGQVRVTGTLDRESISTYSISIRAFRVASNSSIFALSDTSIVSMLITVGDVNDNRPMFLNPSSNPISLIETRQVGSVIYTLHAVDLDSGTNGQITYSLESPLVSPFTIDSGSGVIRTTSVLDFDVRPSYTLTIRATDGGEPERFRDTTLTVNIVDVLDPPPAFTMTAYSVEVSEGTYSNHMLGSVQAVDRLHPTTAIIRYEQVPKGDMTDTLFHVVETGTMAGQVFLTGTVNLARDSYSINIRAFRVLEGSTTPRSEIGSTTMTITITDINNNPPVILNPQQSPITLIETTAVGTIVYTYHATDSDLGSNAVITFSLTPDTPFSIDATSGAVRLTSSLDFNVATMHVLTITARDGGETAQSATTVLTILVTDVTDQPPVFSHNEYSFSIAEGRSNVVIGNVSAQDRNNPSAIIRYQQVMKGDISDTMFRVAEIGVSAGEVRINASADREMVDSYTISIRAFRVADMIDSTPISGISIVPVTISITDVNDNPPRILNPPIETISLLESQLVGSILYTVYATDPDAGSNGEVTYVLTSPVNGPFSIGASTGIVRLTSSLDYDTATAYTVQIRVQDGGSPQMFALTTLTTVNVTDILDPPPTFTESIYSAELIEGTYSNHVLLTVQAIDSLHPSAVIKYEQVMKNDETDALFSVGMDSGQVTLTGIIDRESDRTHTMNIRAFRVVSTASNTPHSAVSIVTVVLTVLDANDNPPLWLNPINTPISVLETSQVGTLVYSLIVSDRDEGSNGRISFARTSSDESFAVNQMGEVTVNAVLNSEDNDVFALNISARDQGSPSLSTDINLVVMVTGAADPSPTFTTLVYTANTPEADHSTSPLRVTDVTATPGIEGNVIRYSIITRADGSHTPFSVGTSDGVVRFRGILDREAQRTWTVVILATEVDPVTLSPTMATPAHSTVILTVTDINDNAPAFITDHLFGRVSELARVGDIAAAGASAFDADEGTNALFSYSISSPLSNLPFTVDPITGIVSVNGALDYETTRTYQFTLMVRETRTEERLSSNATVNIEIINENDNSPVFARTSYTFQVAENTDPRVLISTTPPGLTAITASDIDQGLFGDLTYTLVGFGVPGRFAVSSDGVISTTAQLNYEDRTEYHLTLIARDGGGTLMNPNQAATQIVIQVLDVNDHTPVCFPSSTSVILEENMAFPNFLNISATDGDPPNTANSRLSYGIAFSNRTASSPLFTINSTSGQISAAPLNYEDVPTHMYALTVMVSDAGSPSVRTSTCSVVVTVRDSNDNSPRFSQSVYIASIAENHVVGSPVGVTVLAIDPEVEHTVTYFQNTGDADSAFFLVDQTSGMVQLAQFVDYDPPFNHRDFTFRVLAIDSGTPPLTGTATIMITITPENDNSPIITNPPLHDPFNYSLVEDRGTPTPFPLLSVNASDLDGDTLTYSFTSPNAFFSIDGSSGDVVLVATLDRETQASHVVGIRACDPQRRCDSVTIFIMVTDYNDNSPNFISTPTVMSVRECEVMNEMVITTVRATDAVDLGPHSVVTYAAVGGNRDRFSVGAETGIVRLIVSPTILWDYETSPRSYTFNISATDFPGGTPRLRTPTDAVVTLALTDCNDFPPIFSSSSYSFSLNERTMAPATNEEIFTGISFTDGDATSENRNHVFSIIGAPTSTNGWFGIDSNTGRIHIVNGAIIDRENSFLTIDSNGRGVMSFSVLVVNAAPTATFSSTATVTVTVNDINDNNPVIQQTDPISVTVLEHSTNGTLLTVISAVDLVDFGVNTHVVYEIISGNEEGKFAINRETGVLTVVGDLDHEVRTQYRIRVQAREDLGVPVSTPDTINVIITVVGANDFNPVFDFNSYNASLQEFNAITMSSPISPGQTIVTVRATDRDGTSTSAGRLEYRITNGAMQLGVQMFAIPDRRTGRVTILRPDLLDYEGQQRFDVFIEAYDLVTPINERRQGTTQLTVYVVDVNDAYPMFLNSGYNGSVAEGQPIGTVVIVTPSIQARDADDNGMDQLTYSILTGPPFSISSDGRTVRTTIVLDREILMTQSYRYAVTVQVTDTAGHINSTNLTVTVSDINDNPPCFPESTITRFSAEENSPIFPDPLSRIGRVQAVDRDQPMNPQITYFISEGDMGDFDINSQTGEIFVIGQLNREAIPVYILNITTTDGALTCSIDVVITVLERNDNDPIFTQNPYFGSIFENTTIGTTVDVNVTTTGILMQVEATDIDFEPVITYSILPQPGPDVPFVVNPINGYVFTNATLDREMIGRYSFLIQAHDGMRNSIPARVEIVILDVNDEPPVFITDFFNVTIPEHTLPGFIFLTLEASDADIGTNAEITYFISSIDPPSSPNTFNIDEVRGGVSANSEVIVSDGDPVVVTLTITASNIRSSLPTNLSVPTDMATLVINIEPENINAPQFNLTHYNFEVVENRNGSILGQLYATEQSGDVGTIITYGIRSSGGSDYLNFSVDAINGFLINVNMLDRETRDLYQFTVIATDNAPSPRSGFGTVTVRVLDDNDNVPFFRPTSYTVTIPESTIPNSVIRTVTAFDDDIGTNAALTYSISEGNTSVFDINPISGDIMTLLELDRETVETYNLTVTVQDGGSPSLSSSTSITISISDVNDNSPVFTGGAVINDNVIEIRENTLPPLTLTVLQAVDDDSNGNALIAYSFEDFATTSGPFQINRDTGSVFLRSGPAGSLDRETRDIYEVTVVASDQGGVGPQVRSTPGTFTVRILDVNDSIPTFLLPLYEFQVKENSPMGRFVGQVSGQDADIGSNAILFYHIPNENDPTNSTCGERFCIDEVSGNITVGGMLDYETEPMPVVTVAISNDKQLLYNRTGSLIAAGIASVQVQVLDVNDQAPVFVPASLIATVEEDAPFGTSVARLRATDADTGNGSIVWYRIETENAPFVVDLDTGVVTTVGIFKGQSGTSLEVVVRAFDNFGTPPTQSSTGTMITVVFKCSEQIELSFQRQREVIEAKLDRIISVLTNVTQARVIITSITVRQTQGTVDVTGTDMRFFILDTAQARVVDPGAIIRVIDENYRVVEPVFQECGIQQILTAPCDARTAPQGSFIFPIWLWVVIAILILALCCLLCCCILVCIGERRKSRKWKSHALKADHQSQLDQFSQHQMVDMNVYGQHNPMWVDPYPDDYGEATSSVTADSSAQRSNPLYESQELTIEMFRDTVISSDEEEEEEVDQGEKVYESQEVLLEMFSDDISYGSSKTRLIKAPAKDAASPLNQDMDEEPEQKQTVEIFPETATSSDEEEEEEETDQGEQLYESQEVLLEMLSDDLSEGGSNTRLIKAPAKRAASPLNQDMDDLLERALDDTDDYDSTTSFI